jgi:hypothetical protein
MDEDLFLSILAMDAYNQGDGAGIRRLPAGGIGAATLVDKPLPSSAQQVGFFATVYSWNGKTVISYRGTDTSCVQVRHEPKSIPAFVSW